MEGGRKRCMDRMSKHSIVQVQTYSQKFLRCSTRVGRGYCMQQFAPIDVESDNSTGKYKKVFVK